MNTRLLVSVSEIKQKVSADEQSRLADGMLTEREPSNHANCRQDLKLFY
jgi:hypothetical protein